MVAGAQSLPPEKSGLLAVAANGYRANLEAFEYITCRYTVTSGFAKSLEDAIAGRLEANPRTAKVELYKDGQLLRFRIEEDDVTKAILDKPPKPAKEIGIAGLRGGPIVPFLTTDYLLNGTHGLAFDPRGHHANVYEQETQKGKEVDPLFIFTAIDVNTKHDFGLLADQAARGEIGLRHNGSATDPLRFMFLLRSDPTVEYTVDLSRGSLPVRIEKLFNQGSAGALVTVVPQIRACSKQRWFPERIVVFMKQTPTQSPCHVKDFKVVELDVDSRPSKDVFRIDLPAGTVVNQFDDSRKFFKTRQPEQVGPSDLARIEQLTEKVHQTPLTDTTIVLPRSYTWVWYSAGALGVLAAAFMGRRYLAARRQHASA
jgi:hypothetical protein